MGLVTKTPDALRDLAEIWHFIATDNATAADQLIDNFNQRLEMLSNFPGAGRNRDELSAKLAKLSSRQLHPALPSLATR